MAATRLIPMHTQKNCSIGKCLRDRTEYAKNDEKTNQGEFVSSYECDPRTVDKEFELSKSQYDLFSSSRKGDIIAYQIRQSFKPGEITPEEANQVGYETAMRWTKGNHAFIVATHVDKAHIHNHIIYNSTSLDNKHKFHNFFLSSIALQKVSDLVCLEHGLSVIKPKRYDERQKRTVYPNRKSIRDKIREDFDLVMKKNPKDMNELLKFLEEMGYEIRKAKHIAIKGEEQKGFIRIDSLGEGYREKDFDKIFNGEETFNPPPPREKQSHRYEKAEKKFDMLVDIQDIIAKGKGPGYERWAKVHNIKQISQTLLFLRDHDIRDMDELTKRAGESSEKFAELSQTIKDAEKRMAEIAVLKTHIINYSKTKDVYVAYRKAGYSKQFFEAHREEILLHKAAKEAFSQFEGGIPKLKELNQKYAELLQKKKEAYSEYRAIKEENKELQVAKYNLERFLNQQEEEQKAQEKQHKKNEQSL